MDLGYSSESSDSETNQNEDTYATPDDIGVKLTIPGESNVDRKKRALECFEVNVITDTIVDKTDGDNEDTGHAGALETEQESASNSEIQPNVHTFDGDKYYNENKLMKAELASETNAPSFSKSRSNQLSSLISFTEQNKDELEKRFISARMKKRQKKSEYGF